jgi:hypothetical protein
MELSEEKLLAHLEGVAAYNETAWESNRDQQYTLNLDVDVGEEFGTAHGVAMEQKTFANIFGVQRQLFARSERVKGIDFHPVEPWILTTLYSGHVYIWSYETQVCLPPPSSIQLSQLLL